MDTTIECIVDGAHGIYVPQAFAEQSIGWHGIDPEDLAILRAGPDHADYWEAWDVVLATAFYKDSDGCVWMLFQDGDLFAIRDDHEFEN